MRAQLSDSPKNTKPISGEGDDHTLETNQFRMSNNLPDVPICLLWKNQEHMDDFFKMESPTKKEIT